MIAIELFHNEDRYNEFKQGRTIFKEGDAGAPMYVALEGNVTLSVKSHAVEELGPGGVLGEGLQIMRVIADRLRRMDQRP